MDDSFSTVQGGTMTLPVFAQIVYLDFDGELTKYRNQELNLDIDVTVEDSRLSPERIKQITDSLNEQYASQNVHFVTERPEDTEYSTIYVGKTSSFSQYGTFAGLAEAIDSGNQNQSDNAFVILDSTSDNAQIISTISHELDHLLGTLDHGGEGLAKYAKDYCVESGQTVSNIVLTFPDNMYVYEGGTAKNTTVRASAQMYVSCGGSADRTAVGSNGYLFISSGGTATNTIWTPCVGNIILDDGGCMTFASQYKGCYYGSSQKLLSSSMVMNDKTVANGSMYVMQGGTADRTTVTGADNAFGYVYVMSGGLANSTTVSAGGIMIVSSGGTADKTKVETWGEMRVHGGTANNTVVERRCSMSVSGDGMANNIEICSGGYLGVDSNGKLCGTLQIASGSVVSAFAGAVIDFTVAEQTNASVALINNWGLISGGADADYTLTVNVDQADGTYILAEGATGFAKTLTVKTTNDATLGTLTLGETKTFGKAEYSLVKTDDVLSLTIEAKSQIFARSDVDGNGISDVMFQWTGGDYQIGFWMNGTSTWQGQGIGQPSNWKLVGAYDMDQNGKADLVMRGNIQIGSDKGAYIGYYKDGDVTQWQNISFLNNPGDVDWKLAVGNVTGNENCNSIVWHAPELGALGVWTDGTANWVSLAGGFDSNWTMLGCGDFDGNGKDEVLFSHAGDLYTTDIDQKFASLGGWGAEWEVKAIGDFAGDGKDDIIVQNGNIIAKFKDGKAENWESVGVMDSSDWFICGTGDYNGDQKDDLLVRQYSTGMLGYYESGDMSKWAEMGRGVDTNWTVIA